MLQSLVHSPYDLFRIINNIRWKTGYLCRQEKKYHINSACCRSDFHPCFTQQHDCRAVMAIRDNDLIRFE